MIDQRLITNEMDYRGKEILVREHDSEEWIKGHFLCVFDFRCYTVSGASWLQAKPVEESWREPTDADACSGWLECRVRDSDNRDWERATLLRVVHRVFVVLLEGQTVASTWNYCQIKVNP